MSEVEETWRNADENICILGCNSLQSTYPTHNELFVYKTRKSPVSIYH